MNYFRRLELTIDVPEFDMSSCRLAQTADVPNRDRYKYTLWEKESAPPTPLHVFEVPNPYATQLRSQIPQAVLDREVPGVFYMRMEKPHPDSTVPPHVDVAVLGEDTGRGDILRADLGDGAEDLREEGLIPHEVDQVGIQVEGITNSGPMARA